MGFDRCPPLVESERMQGSRSIGKNAGVVFAACTITYALIVSASAVCFTLDPWAGSRAVAAGLMVGISSALAALGCLRLSGPLWWAPSVLFFGLLAHWVRVLYAGIEEAASPQSTLGGSGTDILVLAFPIIWVVGLVLTCIHYLSVGLRHE